MVAEIDIDALKLKKNQEQMILKIEKKIKNSQSQLSSYWFWKKKNSVLWLIHFQKILKPIVAVNINVYRQQTQERFTSFKKNFGMVTVVLFLH